MASIEPLGNALTTPKCLIYLDLILAHLLPTFLIARDAARPDNGRRASLASGRQPDRLMDSPRGAAPQPLPDKICQPRRGVGATHA